jgi:release factor glutamine methyltransferase
VTSSPAAPFASVGAALEWARRELEKTESGPLEAQVLLARLMGRTRSWIIAHLEFSLDPSLTIEYAARIGRIRNGEPLAYLTGVQEFYGLEFEVTPDVLIPRPETELLVSTALDWLALRRTERLGPPVSTRVVDLGTGSGCVAAVLAVREREARVVATDISARALAVAARNLARHGVRDRVSLVQADLLSAVRGPVDLLCANLPYALTPILDASRALRFEPRLALDGGEDGLRLVRRALDQAASRIAEGGLALFEIDAVHAERARQIARQRFPQSTLKIKKDLAGWERLLVVRQP